MTDIPPDMVASTDQAAAEWNMLLDRYIEGFKQHAERDGFTAATLNLGAHFTNCMKPKSLTNMLVVAIRRLAQ